MPQKPPWTKKLRCGWSEAIVGLVLLLTISGFFGRYGWCLDLAASFRFHYFVLSGIAALIAARVRKPRTAWICMLCALVNLIVVAPLYWRETPKPAQNSARFRLLLLNLDSRASDPARMTKAVSDSKADVIVLEGVTEQWQQQLGSSIRLYRHVFSEPREDKFGIAILSKSPFDASEMTYFGDAEVPSMVSQFTIGGQRVQLIATHPLPPTNPRGAALRDGQLSDIATYLKRRKSLRRGVVVVGDLNVTPWSYSFRNFLRQTGLRNTARGFGIQSTWPTTFPPSLIPLDHCLVSSNVVAIQRSVRPSTGSDHYPLLVELALMGD